MSTGRSLILAVQGTVLDLGVNFASERGLLGIATYPNFPSNPGVSLYWTCRSTALPADPFGFVRGRGLGPQYEGDLFMGGARSFLQGGHLFHFNLTGNRRKIGVADPRLEDRVADNLCKFDLTESESLLIGRNFGTVTDIISGPSGNLFVVSIDKGSVFEIFRRR